MPIKDREERNAQARARYATNPEKYRAKTRVYHKANRAKNAAAARAYYDANKERLYALEKQRYQTDPDFRARKSDNAKKYRARYPDKAAARSHYRYNTAHEIEAGRAKPDNCDICGGTKKIVFDHCHQKGHFRGWLCQPCNVALGMVHDDVQHLLKLIAYLRRNQDHAPPQLTLIGI